MASTFTADSVARARAYQQAEREQFAAQTGARFVGDEIVLPPKMVVITCGRCWYVASARSEGAAVRCMAAHIIGAHLRKESQGHAHH